MANKILYIQKEGVTTGDPALCSPFLIWSLYAHTARHIPSLMGRVEEFAVRVYMLLSVGCLVC